MENSEIKVEQKFLDIKLSWMVVLRILVGLFIGMHIVMSWYNDMRLKQRQDACEKLIQKLVDEKVIKK